MLQFLRFDENMVSKNEFSILSGTDIFKFFVKRFAYLLLIIYSIFFLTAVLESVPSKIIYLIGITISLIISARLTNHVIKYKIYKNGKLLIDVTGIEIKRDDQTQTIPAESISNISVDLLGNLVIKQQDSSYDFPISLISDEERSKILNMFLDKNPNRTILLMKTWDLVDALFIAFILAMHIRQFIVQAYFIPTGSMEDTLQVGDHLLVEKLTFGPIIPKMSGMSKMIHINFLGIRDIQRGDIIIFRPPHEKEKDFIKRCIALPGDDFTIKNGSVYINGKKMEEPYTKDPTSYSGFGDKKIEGKVKEGHVIVLGDNRKNSYDGRGFGYLPIESIKGRAFILYWNTKQIKDFDFSRLPGFIR